MSERLALGAALYFDHEFAANPSPLATLLHALVARTSDPALVQSYVNVSESRSPPAAPIDLERLLTRVASGLAYSVSIDNAIGAPDEDRLGVTVTTSPATKLSANRPPLRSRYDLDAVFGARRIEQLGLPSVLHALIEFASAVNATAGVMLWAPSARLAEALVTGRGQLAGKERDRVDELMFWASRWGTLARGPAWGTIVGRAHVEILGGMDRVRGLVDELVQPRGGELIPLRTGGAFIRLATAPIADGVDYPGLDKLSEFLHTVTKEQSGVCGG